MVRSESLKSLTDHTRSECVKSFLVNFMISGGLTYWVFSKHASIEPWGAEGYAVDLSATGFFMAAIVAAIYIVKHRRSKRRWPVLEAVNGMDFIADRMPYGVTLASMFIGVIGLASAAILLLIIVPMDAHIEFTALGYALMKAVWAGVLAMAVVYMAVRCGLKINNAQYQL